MVERRFRIFLDGLWVSDFSDQWCVSSTIVMLTSSHASSQLRRYWRLHAWAVYIIIRFLLPGISAVDSLLHYYYHCTNCTSASHHSLVYIVVDFSHHFPSKIFFTLIILEWIGYIIRILVFTFVFSWKIGVFGCNPEKELLTV